MPPMKKILIVDDNLQNLYMLEIMLKTNGFEVDQALNGAGALEMAHQSPPDMIVSDILMPVMDGFSLCRNWMADKDLKDIPFIFYTATYTDYKDEVFALSLGADRFLVKPMAPDDFLAVIQDVFKTHPTHIQTTAEKPAEKESQYYKEYSEVLIHKLEDKMAQLEQTNKRLTALYQASCNLVSIKSLPALIHAVLYSMVETAGYQQANYFHLNENENKLCLLDTVGISVQKTDERMFFELDEEQGLVGLVAKNRQIINIADIALEPRLMGMEETIHSALYVPVQYENRILGVLSLFSMDMDAFQKEDEHHVSSFANSLAVSIKNIQAEEALSRQNLLLTALMNSPVDDAIFSVDQNYRYTTFNEKHRLEMQKTWHVDIQEGMNLLELLTGSDSHHLMKQSIDRVLTGEAFMDIQYQPDTGIYYEFNWNPIWQDQTHVMGVTAFIRNVTERMQAQEKILQFNAELEKRVFERTAQLEAVNQELETFSYSVSHDLRAPLRAILGFSGMITRDYRDSLDAQGQHYFDNIVAASTRMDRLIDDLLQYSRLGRRGIRHEPVNLDSLFASLTSDLSERLSADRAVLTIASDLPTLLSDRTLLTQIFTNLLDNAITYHPKDRPVQVSVTWQREESSYVICVSDNGIGIPAEYHEKIFNAFQRLHNQEEYPGSGIGLATVKKSVLLLGGDVRVESQVGKGSTFSVYLPGEKA